MKCPNCGSIVDPDSSFCGYCGNRVMPVSYAPFPYAGFWTRFVASLIDGLIVGFGVGIPFGVVVFLVASAGIADFIEIALFAWIWIASPIAGWLYSALLESSERQATLGKSAMGIKVIDLAGNRMSFGRASGRHFGKYISGLILSIGYIMAAFTEQKQALHDMMAGTLVVKS